MDVTELEIAKIKLIENKLFYLMNKWNDENYKNSLIFCEREKLSNEIENLKLEYSIYCIRKPKDSHV